MDCTEQLKMCLLEAGLPHLATAVDGAWVNPEDSSEPFSTAVEWQDSIDEPQLSDVELNAVKQAFDMIRATAGLPPEDRSSYEWFYI